MFSADAIGELIDAVRARLELPTSAEITLEANPNSVTLTNLRALRQAGINRLSLGIQTLCDGHLRRLGRRHDRHAALTAVAFAEQAGFERINLDLMFGLPEQSLAQAITDLHEVIALAPEHVSYYQLTLEEATPFARSPPRLPDPDTVWAMQMHGLDALAAAGYDHYEVSAYALPGRACRHNLNYWQFGDYLGLGAGAHSKLTDPTTGRITRHCGHADPARYIRSSLTFNSPWQDSHLLAPDDIVFELMLNALRLSAGVSWSIVTDHTGLKPSSLQPFLAEPLRKGWLWSNNWGFGATSIGQLFLNDLLQLFLPPSV